MLGTSVIVGMTNMQVPAADAPALAQYCIGEDDG